MSNAVAIIEHIRGETVSFGLRSDPAYDGTETVTCDVKVAINGSRVPPASAATVASITPSFVEAAGDVRAYWSFNLTPTQTAALAAQIYITDAKVVYSSGVVDYPLPLAIKLAERVTV